MIRNIPKDVYAVLRQDAKRNRRSLNAKVVATLADKAEMARRRVQAAKVIVRLRRHREKIPGNTPINRTASI